MMTEAEHGLKWYAEHHHRAMPLWRRLLTVLLCLVPAAVLYWVL